MGEIPVHNFSLLLFLKWPESTNVLPRLPYFLVSASWASEVLESGRTLCILTVSLKLCGGRDEPLFSLEHGI